MVLSNQLQNYIHKKKSRYRLQQLNIHMNPFNTATVNLISLILSAHRNSSIEKDLPLGLTESMQLSPS
jgi:hypothetical protein